MPDSQIRKPQQQADPQGQDPATPPPSYKRRRIALACTSCRNRKSRCNGAKPSCSLCVELGFECVYQQPAAGNVRPGEPPSGYDERLRAIEDTLRLLVNQKVTSAGEAERPPQSSPDQNSSVREASASTHEARQASNDDEDIAILDEVDSVQQIAEDSVDGMAAITDPEETESRFFGPSSNIALLRHISDATSATLRAIGQSRHSENGANQPIVSRVASPVATTFSETSPISRLHINVRSLPAEARALHLIQLFFSDTGMLFPYIHQQDILRTYSAARRNRFTAVSRSWLCLINVIFAFATYISANPNQSAEKNAAESEIFIERAQALSAEIEMKSASLETGDIIAELYGDNVDIDPGLAIPTMMERTVVLEQKLAGWKHHLIGQLQRRPWDTHDQDGISVSTWDPVFDRLSVILTLRYLNTRIVLHRPILSAFLRQRARSRNLAEPIPRDDPFFNDLGERSVRICQQAAMEIVEIVHRTSKPPALLGAWWFTAYYTFNAALVIFSCILLELTISNVGSPSNFRAFAIHSPDAAKVVDMVIQLRRAMEALQRFGEGTKSAKRIRKTLVKLMQICMTLVQSNSEQGPAILSALTASQQGEVAQSHGQTGMVSQNHGIMDGSAAMQGMLPTLAPDDPFAMFDMGMQQQYWADNSLDLFTDLVGIEPGLTAMMAG
ncbi:hypothetical protein H2200_001709 [Cladophialophora chaetospira]|uniref:Zn(2)-C6 fungal-type domain-containing protein n=1 Tax=Cladophialophora chaetospira TaxID=386627 RepID=A0AA38XLE8_9EURO|nr:hypothetical protein H2200_001709 [Cladophialophora chaetospira]